MICVSLIAGGGSMTPALKRLGFKVYDMDACFKSRWAPMEWAKIIRGQKHYDPTLLEGFDACSGIPTSSCWERIYRGSPEYTKVILAVEEDKYAWAKQVSTSALPVIRELEKVGKRSKVGKEWATFFQNMWPREITHPSDAATSFAKSVMQEKNKVDDSVRQTLSTAEMDASSTDTHARAPTETVDPTTPKTPLTDEEVAARANMSMEDLAEMKKNVPGGSNEDVLRAAAAINQLREQQSMLTAEETPKARTPQEEEEELLNEMMAEGLADFEANVKDVVSEGRLLVFHREDGWQPLCDFLDIPTPEATDSQGNPIPEPFPAHDDGTKTLESFIVRLRRAGQLSNVLVYSLAFIVVIQLLPLAFTRAQQLPGQVRELRKEFMIAYGWKDEDLTPVIPKFARKENPERSKE